MPFGIEISFPTEPTKEDLKELRRQVAHDMFEVVKGGEAKSNPTCKSNPDRDKTKSTSDKT